MNDNRDHLRALLAAYCEGSGRSIEFRPSRMAVLRELDRRKITPADVAQVMQYLRSMIQRGQGGYSAASLDFGNAMDPDKLEDKLARIREHRLRREGARSATDRAREVAVPRQLGDGVSAIVHAPVSEAQRESIAAAAARELAEFKRKMGRPG